MLNLLQRLKKLENTTFFFNFCSAFVAHLVAHFVAHLSKYV